MRDSTPCDLIIFSCGFLLRQVETNELEKKLGLQQAKLVTPVVEL